MFTRVFSIILVAAFAGSAVILPLFVMTQTGNDEDNSAVELLENYEPTEQEEISQLKTEDLKVGRGVLVEDDPNFSLMVSYQAAKAASGEIFEEIQEETFSLGSDLQIEGLLTGLLGMKVGGQRRLLIPAELAFGQEGYRSGNKVLVGENEAVVYDVNLLSAVLPKQQRINRLEIEDLYVGSGKTVAEGDQVTVNYIGSLADDGEIFDSSYKSGDSQTESSTFALDRVIAGWSEGLLGMKVGGQRRLSIPAYLAYGQEGHPDGGVPADSDLIFQIELLDVIKPATEEPEPEIKDPQAQEPETN